MIRLGLRLTVNGGKEAAVRLVVIVAAVALGVGMLLIAVAGINAVNAQNARYAWLDTSDVSASPLVRQTGPVTPPAAAPSTADPLWWLINADRFDGETIGRVDVAATGPSSPVPPGIPRLPGPGQFYASPALTDLLRSTPAAELGDRFPGTQVGTIGAAALPAPDSLIIVVGRTAADLSTAPGAQQVTSIGTTSPSSCAGHCYDIGINANGLDLVLAVAAAALLFPVLIFIGTATRLAAARREQRFAAMRLVGATPRQIAVIAAIESTVAAAAGVAAGFGLFYLLRPTVAPIPFTGAPFFVSDLSPNLLDVVAIAIGVPVAAGVAARLALRRVTISPLGVTRRVTPRPPRAWRLIPLVAGLGELAYFALAGRPETTSGQIRAYLPGILVTMAGLVIAGPWLTMIGSRIMARRASRSATLIAARRLSDNPKAGFRAVSGVVLALFVASVSVGIITTLVANDGPAGAGTAGNGILVEQSFGPDGPAAIPAMPQSALTKLGAIPGITGVATIHADPDSSGLGPGTGLVSCADLARLPALGRCPPKAAVAMISADLANPGINMSAVAATDWPDAAISAAALSGLPVQSILVATNGSTAAIERARTVLEGSVPGLGAPVTLGEQRAETTDRRLLAGYQQLANVVILVSLVIAGCSLAVSVASGLNERKRPFSLLRLTGAPLTVLRRVVALESAVPLLLVAVISAATGFLAAALFLRSQLDYSLQPPGVEYYAIVVAGLVASLAVIGSTLPLLDRMTGPETARNE